MIAKKLTIPETLFQKTEKVTEEEGFQNVQECILTALREYIKKRENEAFLKKYFQNTNGKQLTKEQRKQLTKEQRKQFAKEMSEEKQLQMLREYNLN